MNTTAATTTFGVKYRTKLEEPVVMYISLVVYSGGSLVSLLGIISMATFKTLVQYIRGTLISFSIANLFGSAYLLLCTIMVYFDINIRVEPNDFPLIVGIVCSTALSLSHLTCIVLAEYIIISARFRRASKSFTGFLFISWVVCITACSNLIFVAERTQMIIAFTLIVFSFIAFVFFYVTVMKYHRNRASYISAIKNSYLRGETPPTYSSGNILFPRIIVASYFASVLPFAIRDVYDVTQTQDHSVISTTDIVFVILFSFNFYIAGIVSIGLRCKRDQIAPA